MWGPVGSLAQAIDEPARGFAAARMLAQRRQCLDEAIAKPGYIDRGELLELTEANVAGDHWRQTPVVRTTQRPDAANAQSCGGDV